jgi:hypothetical protein
MTCRIVGRDRMIVATSHDCAVCRDNHGTHRHFPRTQGGLRLLQGLPHQFVIHPRMLNYQAMKSLRGLWLVLLLVLLPVPGWSQGVRMSADFLPLEVGRQWAYDVTNEAGNKLGQISFAVEDYTIVSGTSFYVFSEFPFSVETEAIRFIRYDRGERYFIRKAGDNEGPLFLDDSSTTEVIDSDSSGAPQKFILRMDEMSLTFQRGVGIVEARMKRSGTPVIAKLVTSPVGPGTRPSGPTAAAPADKTSVLVPAPVTPPRREPPVASVSAQNPRLEVSATPTPDGYRLVMVVTNTSDKLLPLRFTSGQTYDFIIRDTLADREVWRWSNGNFFAQVIRNESIRAESKWQFDVTWNRKDNDDKPVPAGAYRLTAIVTSSPLLQVSIPLNIP